MLKYEANTKLAHLLNEKNISQADLYRIIENQNEKPITKYLINNLVNGRRTNMNTDTLLKICRALECTPNDILDKDVFNVNHPIQD
jgi:DNA-binding Xre family transcriptional regulator